MGKLNLFLTLLLIIVLSNCSSKVAEIGSQDLTLQKFYQVLENDPEYFGKSAVWIEAQLSGQENWKKLKTKLIMYLEDVALLKDLQAKKFAQSTPPKQKALYYMDVLAEYTKLRLKGSDVLESLNHKNDLINQTLLEEENPDMNAVVISVDKALELSFSDIILFFPRHKDNLKGFIEKLLLPKLELAYEGHLQKFDKEDYFKQFWEMKWRLFLVYTYRKKKELEFQKEFIDDEDRLKDYYQKNKKQFVMYKKQADGTHVEYQLSYSRVREDIIARFARQKMDDWIKSLHSQYNISIHEDYFNDFEEQEIKHLDALNKQMDEVNTQ